MDQKVFKQKVIPLFATTLIVTTAGSIIGMFFINFLANIWVLLGITLLALILIFLIYSTKSLPLLYLFNLILGASLAPILAFAIIIDPLLIAEAFGITTIVFLALSGYAYFSKKDFTFLGGMLFVLLILGIIAALAVALLNLSAYSLAISVFFTLLFAGFVLYDMSSILRKYSNEDYIPAVVALYIDFINLFVNILSILINLKGKE